MRVHRSLLPPALLCTALVIAAALALPGATLPGTADAATAGSDAPAPPGDFSLEGTDLDSGEALFAKHCAVCHGAGGAGDGKLSEHLNPNPGDLRQRVKERSDWEVYLTVRDGGKAIGLSPVMVGFGERLSEQELKDVTAFTLDLAQSRD